MAIRPPSQPRPRSETSENKSFFIVFHRCSTIFRVISQRRGKILQVFLGIFPPTPLEVPEIVPRAQTLATRGAWWHLGPQKNGAIFHAISYGLGAISIAISNGFASGFSPEHLESELKMTKKEMSRLCCKVRSCGLRSPPHPSDWEATEAYAPHSSHRVALPCKLASTGHS